MIKSLGGELKKLLLILSLFLTLSMATVTDIDGNIYETVLIGEQLWMAENLKTTHYQNGDDIPHVIDTNDWDNLNIGAYCEYENNPINSEIYGRLYNWYTIDDSRGVCPEGFHVPSDVEIKQLEMFLGMSQQEANDVSFRGTDQGSQLAGRADLWNDGDLENNPVFDSTGFVAIPGGARIGGNTNFIDMGIWGDYWSSTTQDWGSWVRNFAYYNSASHRQICDKHYGMAIRCVSDNYILGDINGDEILNILDIVLMINMILSNEYSTVADVNEDGSVDVLDVVAIVQMILNSLPEDCFIEPEIGPCEGICPTYYFNQETNECEEFITGCCGVEAFNTLQECQNICE